MTDYDRKARRAKIILAGIGIAAAGALVGGGVVAYTLLDGGDTSTSSPKTTPSAAPSPSASSPHSRPTMTPAKGNMVKLDVPTGQKDGVSTGFRHTTDGSVSAAVYFWEEYAFLDDHKARQQLTALTSPDAPGYIDQQISEVRKLREAANLPPSGGTPAGITFTTSVNAVRARSMDKTGDVVHVWMNYDRFATKADGQPDENPLKGENTDVIVKWQNGAWRLTNEPLLWKKRSSPVAYDPDSPYAWQDGWWQVDHAD